MYNLNTPSQKISPNNPDTISPFARQLGKVAHNKRVQPQKAIAFNTMKQARAPEHNAIFHTSAMH
jgi:hypothetical protein